MLADGRLQEWGEYRYAYLPALQESLFNVGMPLENVCVQEKRTCESAQSSVLTAPVQESCPLQNEKRDGILLRYIARRVHLALQQLDLDHPGAARRKRPLVFHLPERRGRTHRLVIYQPQDILLHIPLSFVGFLSKRQKPLRPSIIKAIERAAKKLVKELAGAPGILSYSSLEMRNGDWCNLVILSDAGAKEHVKSNETHQHAAYLLAHTCYEWIRLHDGVMPLGLDHMEMQVERTRYYDFHQGQA